MLTKTDTRESIHPVEVQTGSGSEGLGISGGRVRYGTDISKSI